MTGPPTLNHHIDAISLYDAKDSGTEPASRTVMLPFIYMFISAALAGSSTDFVYPLVYDVPITGMKGAATFVSVSKNLNLFLVSRHVWSMRDTSKPLLAEGEEKVFCSDTQSNDYCLIRSPMTPAKSYAVFSLEPLHLKNKLTLIGNGHNLGIRELQGFISAVSKDSYFFHCIPDIEGDSGGVILNSEQKVVAINVGSQKNSIACPGMDHGGRGVSSRAIYEELLMRKPELLNEIVFEEN